MSNVVKNVDNRGGIINQTTIKKYFVLKPKRWFQKIFQKKKYYNHLITLLSTQLTRKIEVQKNNRKYIPDIFLELDEVKESLRCITQPILFYQKYFDEIQNIKLYFFNEVLKKLGSKRQELHLGYKLSNPESLRTLYVNINKMEEVFQNIKKSIPKLDEYKIFLTTEEKIDVQLKWFIDDFNKKFNLLNKRFILLTERAGQGKTNLVCDFVDKVMLKKNLFGLMFTGNEFNNLDKKEIEDVILKDVYGFEVSSITFNEFLEDIEYLCKQNDSVFTIVIDGLNENSDIEQFSQELYQFAEKILENDFIRLIFTCRSEYFDERFKIFKEPSFKEKMLMKSNYMNRYHHQKEELPKYLEDRLLNSYFKFFQVKNTIFDNVKHQLANDFLLLRIFCEVYGKTTNPNASTEQVYDIYKDDLFKRYFEYKQGQIAIKTSYTKTDFQKLLKIILDYMIKNHKYVNIPFEDLNEINKEFLNYIIDEDIFFRKDLIKDKSSVFANKEVLNFTFDEFRDYLLADYLVDIDICIEEYMASINKDDTNIEGIEKYLFFKSRKYQYREKLKFLEDLEHYNKLFLNNIFSIRDEDIIEDDIVKIKELFKFGVNSSKRIIHFLMFRHKTEYYKNLNIFTLFEIIILLDDKEYMGLVNPKFKIENEYYSRRRSGQFLDLLQELNKIVDSRDFSTEYQLHNIFEFMFLLLGVEDESRYGDCPYELMDLLKKYIDKYPKEAKKILLKYKSIKIDKIKENIWKLLNYYSDKYIDFDEEFCQELFSKIETESDTGLKNIYQVILEKCYEYNSELFTEEQKDFFIALHAEREKRIQFFQDMANGKIDPEHLFKELDI